MDSALPDASALVPLPYHLAVVDYLKSQEPDVWAWASSFKVRDEHVAEVRAHLLRDTYRLDAAAHPEVHAALGLVMQRLGISAPASIYQSGGQQMNASLLFVPGEVHVILQGPVLEHLTQEELLALFGHELSHYLLWSCDEGAFHTAERILNDAMAAAASAASHHETARRYYLHTELFADRGGAVAAGAVAPAVSTLVKVHTGIASADAAAYLRQASEVDAADAGATAAATHPETFIRARALDLWWQGAGDLNAWLERRLQGPLALDRLDLPGQLRLAALTRGFLTHFLADGALRTEAVANQVRALFPDWSATEAPAALSAFESAQVDDSVRHYLNALMLDVALVDPDIRDAALLHAARTARTLGTLEALQLNLKRDARFGKRDLDRLNKQLAKATDA
ncbi:M48 family metalloprotease [Cupriavidus sp. 2TAF22]|uniref:M48 family metalloprotease n=1 Tax=unclassified Cupriavidus TaxID=2640874 RepID=UPI003F932612